MQPALKHAVARSSYLEYVYSTVWRVPVPQLLWLQGCWGLTRPDWLLPPSRTKFAKSDKQPHMTLYNVSYCLLCSTLLQIQACGTYLGRWGGRDAGCHRSFAFA